LKTKKSKRFNKLPRYLPIIAIIAGLIVSIASTGFLNVSTPANTNQLNIFNQPEKRPNESLETTTYDDSTPIPNSAGEISNSVNQLNYISQSGIERSPNPEATSNPRTVGNGVSSYEDLSRTANNNASIFVSIDSPDNPEMTYSSDKITSQNLNGFNLPVFAWRWAGIDIKAELVKLKAEGFNAIRIFIYWDNLMPTKGILNEAYFTINSSKYGLSIDNWINYCAEINMSCIIALAFQHWEPPPPAWAFPNIVQPGDNPGTVWDCMMNGTAPAEVQSIDDIWVYIAQRYKDDPWVVFDLFNEPRKGQISDTVLAAGYKDFIDGIVDAIRANEKVHHRIVVEYYINVYAPDNIAKDVIRDIHWYDIWEKPYNRTNLFTRNLNEFAKRYNCVASTGLPVMVLEFGRILHPIPEEGSEDWYNDTFKIFDQFEIKSWCLYCYCHNVIEEPYSIINPDGPPMQPYYSIIQANLPKNG
jgi:hypothetical protein